MHNNIFYGYLNKNNTLEVTNAHQQFSIVPSNSYDTEITGPHYNVENTPLI